jgi:hypothetical protein
VQSGFGALSQAARDLDINAEVNALAAKAKAAAADLKSADVNTIKNVAAAAEAKAKAAAGRVEAGAANAAAGLSKGASALRDGVTEGVSKLQLLSAERLLAFFMLCFTAAILLALAFIVGLPAAPIAPAKFAIPFTLGSACNMAAVGALRGPRAQLTHMMAPERAPLSLVYLGAMAATLWATFAVHSYVLCILASLIQLAALIIYQLSYFPGGLAGAKLVWLSAGRVLRPAVSAAGVACSACWRGASEARSLGDLLPL